MTETIQNDGRRQRGDRARLRIVSHALAISSTEGLEGLSIGRVAKEAGVGKSNIQILFGDKEALQLATLEMAIELYQREVVAPAMEQPSALQRLLSLVEYWFLFVERRTLPGGCFINAVSNEYRARPGLIRDRINDYRRATRDRFRHLIQQAIDSGELQPGVESSQLVFNLCAFQAIANVSALMNDNEEFELARRTSLDLIYRHTV